MTGINPFQWVMKLANQVSAPAKTIKQDLITLESTSGLLEKKWNNIRTLAMGALGFYTLREGMRSLKSEMAGFDEEWTNLGNIFGSDVLGRDVQNWISQVTTDIPVARKSLEEMARSARKFNLDIRELDLKSMMGGAIVAGKDMQSIFGEVAGLTQQMFVTYEDAVQASISLTNSTKSANAIMKAMGSTAWNSAERFKALSDVIGKSVPDAIERQKQSIGGLKQIISSYWDSFKQAMMGDPIQGGLLKEYRKYLASIVEFFEANAEKIKAIMRGLGEVIGVFINFFSDLGTIFAEQVEKMFFKAEGKVQDFHKDIVLPFVTFLEIIKIRALALIEGFVEGFLQSPVWTAWKQVLGFVVTGLKDILKFLGLLDPESNNAIDNWKSLGKMLGTVFSLWVSFGMIGKIVAFGKAFVVAFKSIRIAMMTNPLGIILAAAAAVIGIMMTFENQAEKLHKKQMKRRGDMINAFRDSKKEQKKLSKEILAANTLESKRIALIKEHNKKYGTTIKYTRDLKNLERQLANAADDVNEAIITRIANRLKEEEIEGLMTQMLKDRIKLKKIKEGDFDVGTFEAVGELLTAQLKQAKDIFTGEKGLGAFSEAEIYARAAKDLQSKKIEETQSSIDASKEELKQIDENYEAAKEDLKVVLLEQEQETGSSDITNLGVDGVIPAVNQSTREVESRQLTRTNKQDKKIVIETNLNLDGRRIAKTVNEVNERESTRRGK